MAKFTTVSAADLVRKDMFLEGLRFATGESPKVQAKRLGIPLNTLKRIEAGKAKKLSEKTWRAIAKGLSGHSNVNLKRARTYTEAGPIFMTEKMRKRVEGMTRYAKGRKLFREKMAEFDETGETPEEFISDVTGAKS